MIKLIKQRTPSDCSICCLSMISGFKYETVMDLVGDCYSEERGLRYISQALERLGYDHSFKNGHPVGQVSIRQCPYGISPEFFRATAWGRQSLISVPSLNNKDGHHMIYFDGEKVFDPSNKKCYEDFHQLLPFEIVLFRGASHEPIKPLPNKLVGENQ